MTDFTALLQPDRGQSARTLHVLGKGGFDDWLRESPAAVRQAVEAQRFAAKPGELALIPASADSAWDAVLGLPETPGPWDLASAAQRLPAGEWRPSGTPGPQAALGWLLAQHRFGRYRKEADPAGPRVLLTAEPTRIDETLALARAVALVRDMVDTPAADMGPAEIAAEVERVARPHAAIVTVVQGDALADGYPMIHAVGRAAAPHRAPRLIELEWGDPAHPRLAVIGKGVCFDSGGLDIKPSAGMRLMKKDMGGAAHALALAGLIMERRLPVRLHLLIPAVENAVSADAFRPGDVLSSRKGLTVEIGNTDAEGRLVLGDAIARAGETPPALLIDFATLTGAARVALGPDLPALFANDDMLAADLLAAGDRTGDPLWRMPLWAPYLDLMKSDVADINNAADSGFAGAVTAALFLQKFVPEGVPWAHFDTFAWMPSAKPGRPRGGEALGLRAAWAMLSARFAG